MLKIHRYEINSVIVGPINRVALSLTVWLLLLIALRVTWLNGRVAILLRVLACVTVAVCATEEGSCTVRLSTSPMVLRKVTVLVGMAIPCVSVAVSVVEGRRSVLVVTGINVVSETVTLLNMDVIR